MAIPYFLDKPESNQGIIRQVIFPKFRGINKFLYLRQGDEMKYKEIAQSQNDEVVKFGFEKTLKSLNVEEQAKNNILTEITEIFHDLIVECLATIGLSEYVAAEIPEFKEKLKIDWSDFANNDEFCVEKLMQQIFDNYVSVITRTAIAPSLMPFLPNFMANNPLKLSNPPTITTNGELEYITVNGESEYNKYMKLLNPDNGVISKDFLFEEDRLPLAFAYCFYYALKDVLSTCYLQITLPAPVTPPVNQLGLNILEEITLDLKALPAKIADPTKLPGLIDDLNVAIAEQSILASPNASLVAPEVPPEPNFKTIRALKSSQIELTDKLTNIHNYNNNPDNIPVIQLEEMNNDV